MIVTWLALLFSATDLPVVPTTVDLTQPTCLALSSRDADALYVVPRQICDSRVCRLRIELQPISAWTAAPEPQLLAEGDPLQGALLWTAEVRARVQEAVSHYRLPCRTTPASGPLLAGKNRYTLKLDDGVWWARSENGREQALRKVGGATDAEPNAVDGHPDARVHAFARTTDLEGKLVVKVVPLSRLAAPAFADIIAKPRSLDEDLMCLGWDRDTPAMLVRSTRRVCSADGTCRDEEWLLRVTKSGGEDLARLDGSAKGGSQLADLDVGCTSDDLDEPTYDGRPLMVGPSLSEKSIDVSVWEPREKHWDVGALRPVRTHEGTEREDVTDVLWHPDVRVLVLRVAPKSGEGERWVWVDLAARKIAPPP